MKKISFFLALLTILSLFVSTGAWAKCVPHKKVSYVALGDSLVYGLGSTSGNDYVSKIGAYLSKKYPNVNVTNLGVPGFKSSELLLQLTCPASLMQNTSNDNPYKNHIADICKKTQRSVKNADIISVCIGGNNLLGGFNEFINIGDASSIEKNLVDFKTQYPLILAQIRALNPRAKIYTNNLYNLFPKDYTIPGINGDRNIYSESEIYVDQINRIIEKPIYRKVFRYKVADVHKGFANSDLTKTIHFLVNKDVHPTDLGYSIFFELYKDLVN